MTRLRGILLLLGALTLVAPLAAACDDDQDKVVNERFTTFLADWRKADFSGFPDLLTPQGRTLDAAAAKELLAGTEGDLSARRPDLTPHGKAQRQASDATLGVAVAWTLPDGRKWAYDTAVHARLLGKRWQVYFGPSTVHPKLEDGQHLSLRATPAGRGKIAAADGTPIAAETPVVYVGVEPRAVPDVPGLVAHLGDVFRSVQADVDVQGLPAKLQAAKPDAFVDVVTLRRSDFDEIATDLNKTPGIRVRAGTLSLPMTRTFARALLGTSGPATKEIIDASNGALKAGDVSGLTGMQRRYDTQLRGLPGVSIAPLDAKPGATPGEPLFTLPAQDGAVIATTIDVKVQQAADAALAGSGKPSALVAVKVSDGTVLAVANGPGPAGYNLAFLGEIPGPAWPADPASLGVGGKWSLGADVFTGRADATGVTAAPIGYAAAAAALSRGAWQEPVLIKDTKAQPGAKVQGTLDAPNLAVGVRDGIAYCAYVTDGTSQTAGAIADAFLAAVK
ncbi:NTF2-like N-terminal transpeptidase domain-containing protein [Dactylosporangium sp. CA-052675]|uniref:NTF2-like N-terminal transpeptidase domain-containing protein n=1 Tax=Dactylosporangium sp. CA-052675 TaxID=3239927 RepID=UPI003D8CEC49